MGSSPISRTKTKTRPQGRAFVFAGQVGEESIGARKGNPAPLKMYPCKLKHSRNACKNCTTFKSHLAHQSGARHAFRVRGLSFFRAPRSFCSFSIILLFYLPAFPILVCDGAENPAGIPYGDHVRRDILCHDASRTDDGVLADCHARADYCAAADPYVIFDSNGEGHTYNHLREVSDRSDVP